MPLTVTSALGPTAFDGPHTSVDGLSPRSGVYIITTLAPNGRHNIIDIGESHNVRDRVAAHDRATSWNAHIVDRLYVSAFYCDQGVRMALEQHLRLTYNPPCGIR